jgi:hypothetical protein
LRVTNISFSVVYDDSVTTAEEVCDTLDNLLLGAISTEGILDLIGNPDVGTLEVERDMNVDCSRPAKT